MNKQPDRLRISLYQGHYAWGLSEAGSTLQQGVLHSEAILEHRAHLKDGTLPQGFSSELPARIHGYFQEAANKLGLPVNENFWAEYINTPTKKALDYAHINQKRSMPEAIGLRVSSEVSRRSQVALAKL